MSEQTHTPGPWHMVGDGPMCSSADGPWNPIQTSRGALDLISPKAMKDEHFANARLIAAGPELLNACQEALGRLTENCPEDGKHPESPYHFLYAAIAKAEGRTD